MSTTKIFSKLWNQYTSSNPSVKRVYDLLNKEGEEVLNDHIAFRTVNVKGISIDDLSVPFLNSGYKEVGTYNFTEKKLFAKHFEHKTEKNAPRVFISQLILEKFSDDFQKNVNDFIKEINLSDLNKDELIYSGVIWNKPLFSVYEKLRAESEYAAWFYAYGFRANHFTVTVNNLSKYNTLEKLNKFLKSNGFLLNDSGGEIKGSPELLLEQSSIKAGKILYDFKDGKFEIPSCYYEFAKRYNDKDGKLFSGFIAPSADKIFESTDFYK